MKNRTPSHDNSSVIQALLACCRRLCVEQVNADDLVKWLGVADHREPVGDVVKVKPSDPAWERAKIDVWEDGTAGYVELQPAKGARLTVADLEAVLGAGDEATRLHWNDPPKLAFEYVEGGFACTVYATLAAGGEGAGRRVTMLAVRPDGDV